MKPKLFFMLSTGMLCFVFIIALCLIQTHSEAIIFDVAANNRYEQYYRELIKQENLGLIEAFNADSDNKFKLKSNQFLSLKNDEFLEIYANNMMHTQFDIEQMLLSSSSKGASITIQPIEKQELDGQNQTTEAYEFNQSMSISVDLSGNDSPVKDQGSCNSCYAHSTMAVMENMIKQWFGTITDLSEQQITDCTYDWAPPGKQVYNNDGCNGGWGWKAFHYAKYYGVTFESNYPYVSGKTGQVTSCPKSKKGKDRFKIQKFTFFYDNDDPESQCNDLENILRKGKTVAVSTWAPKGIAYQFYGSQTQGIDIFDMCGPYETVNHQMQLVGATDRYWKLKNSYGPDWGEKGYIYLDKSNGLNCLNVCMDFAYAQNVSFISASKQQIQED